MSEKFEELIKSFQNAVSGFLPGFSTDRQEIDNARTALVEYVARLEEEVERLNGIEAKAIEQSEIVQRDWLSPFEAEGWKAENARLQDRLAACEASLVGMVQQYCAYWDDINPDATYHHDFMSAGENAFRYLLAYNIATLADNGVDIRFSEVE